MRRARRWSTRCSRASAPRCCASARPRAHVRRAGPDEHPPRRCSSALALQLGDALFERLAAQRGADAVAGVRRAHEVFVSYALLQGDEPHDLLAPPTVPALKRGSRGVHLSGLAELLVSDTAQLAEALALGEQARARRAAAGSHTLFELRLVQRLRPDSADSLTHLDRPAAAATAAVQESAAPPPGASGRNTPTPTAVPASAEGAEATE